MEEFVSVKEMIERIKIIVVPYCDNGIVFQKDVAILLHIDQLTLATMKKRNRPPLSNILKFCKRLGIDPIKILF